MEQPMEEKPPTAAAETGKKPGVGSDIWIGTLFALLFEAIGCLTIGIVFLLVRYGVRCLLLRF